MIPRAFLGDRVVDHIYLVLLSKDLHRLPPLSAMFNSAANKTKSFPFDPTRSNPFSQPSPATATRTAQARPRSDGFDQPTFPAYQRPSCPSSSARNLFGEPQDVSDDAPIDPFGDDIDLDESLNLPRPLDAVKFLLRHFRLDDLDRDLFKRLKERAFTIPHAVEQLIKEDAFFKSLLSRLYVDLSCKVGLDLRSALQDFRSDAIMSQTCVLELADLIQIYCVYRAGCIPNTAVPIHFISQTQEVIEISLRTERFDLLLLVQQCFNGIARFENSSLLTGGTLEDSHGQLLIQDRSIRSKFVSYLGKCHVLYLTANSARLCDIPALIARLLVGDNRDHDLIQLVIGCELERIELWLARRRPRHLELESACGMLNLASEMPGTTTLITDTLKNVLHPVFADALRLCIRLNGVPRNHLSWSDFEGLMADAQLQLDADPDLVIDALKKTAQDSSPQSHRQSNQQQPVLQQPPLQQTQQPNPGNAWNAAPPRAKKDEMSGSDLAKLPPPPATFPKSISECHDYAINCRDCGLKFLFSTNEQDYYIKQIKSEDGTGPHFPVRCSKCRYNKKLRNGDFTVMSLVIDESMDAPESDVHTDNWDEDFSF